MKLAFALALFFVCESSQSQTNSTVTDTLIVQWEKQQAVSRSTPTLQSVVNPMLRKGSPIHDQSLAALKNLGCDYVRYVPWLPYPKLAVAELEAPSHNNTSWDFTLIDPMTIDFLTATKGHPVILNFSTIPAWMYKTEKPVSYPQNPDSVTWNYTQGSQPRDSTFKEMANYFARVYSWYTKGGFTDERGKYHSSGYHFDIPYWEVLNEPDLEHQPTPQHYTRQYDAIVSAIKKESPKTKFVGMALAFGTDPAWFEYFLNPKNHKQGVPLDMISYHFYATPSLDQTIDIMQHTFFDKANGFINSVRFIENIRKRLSPRTRTTVDEIGSILLTDFSPGPVPIPREYWNLSGALYAYIYIALSNLGIDVIGESQLVGYPTQFPSVSMMNWENGKPNARYWVLKLIKDNFSPGDTLINGYIAGTGSGGSDLSVQAFKTKYGRKILLINKRNKNVKLAIPASFKGGKLNVVDVSTGDNEAAQSSIDSEIIQLKPFAVAVISI
jgi:hypothetical protein